MDLQQLCWRRLRTILSRHAGLPARLMTLDRLELRGSGGREWGSRVLSALAARVGELVRDDAVDLLAFQVSDVTADFATNFNIVVQPRGPLDEPDVLLELAPDLVSDYGGESIQAEESTAADLPVVEVSYDLPLPDGTVVMGIQDYLFTDDVIYVATYTAAEPDLELWSSVLDTFTPTE